MSGGTVAGHCSSFLPCKEPPLFFLPFARGYFYGAFVRFSSRVQRLRRSAKVSEGQRRSLCRDAVIVGFTNMKICDCDNFTVWTETTLVKLHHDVKMTCAASVWLNTCCCPSSQRSTRDLQQQAAGSASADALQSLQSPARPLTTPHTNTGLKFLRRAGT